MFKTISNRLCVQMLSPYSPPTATTTTTTNTTTTSTTTFYVAPLLISYWVFFVFGFRCMLMWLGLALSTPTYHFCWFKFFQNRGWCISLWVLLFLNFFLSFIYSIFRLVFELAFHHSFVLFFLLYFVNVTLDLGWSFCFFFFTFNLFRLYICLLFHSRYILCHITCSWY